jgi:thymidine phosphorylase
VGLSELLHKGEEVAQGAPLALVHAADAEAAALAVQAVQAAYHLAESAPPARALVQGRVG